MKEHCSSSDSKHILYVPRERRQDLQAQLLKTKDKVCYCSSCTENMKKLEDAVDELTKRTMMCFDHAAVCVVVAMDIIEHHEMLEKMENLELLEKMENLNVTGDKKKSEDGNN